MKRLFVVAALLSAGAPAWGSPTYPPIVGAGGVALASREATTTICSARVVLQVTEATEDTQPAGARGKAVATGTGLCEGSGVVPYMTDVHLYADGREIAKQACWGAYTCSSKETTFGASALTAVSHQWWDTSRLGWNAATPGACQILSPTRAFCQAQAVL